VTTTDVANNSHRHRLEDYIIDIRLLDKQREQLVELMTDLPAEHILWGVIYFLEDISDDPRPELTLKKTDGYV